MHEGIEKRRINLFEPTVDGHRSRYLGEIIRGIRQRHPDCLMRLCILEAQRSTSGYREFLRPLEPMVEYCPLPDIRMRGRFAEEYSRLKMLRYCLTKFPCDDVVIPYGDGLLPLMGVFPQWLLRRFVPSGIRMESMLFRPEWVYPSPRWKQWIYHRIRRWAICRWPGNRLHLADDNAFERSVDGIDNYHATVSKVPEVFDSWHLTQRAPALQWLCDQEYLPWESIAKLEKFPVISAPGDPSLRKGTVELIQAFLMNVGLDAQLVIWGGIPGAVDQELKARGVPWREDKRIVIIEKYVTEEAFRKLFSISDLVILPYQSHLGGVSSLFLLSTIFRLKTICDQRAWLGWASKHYGHGRSIDCSNVELLSRSLQEALQGQSLPIASKQVAMELRRETMEGGFRGSWCL